MRVGCVVSVKADISAKKCSMGLEDVSWYAWDSMIHENLIQLKSELFPSETRHFAISSFFCPIARKLAMLRRILSLQHQHGRFFARNPAQLSNHVSHQARDKAIWSRGAKNLACFLQGGLLSRFRCSCASLGILPGPSSLLPCEDGRRFCKPTWHSGPGAKSMPTTSFWPLTTAGHSPQQCKQGLTCLLTIDAQRGGQPSSDQAICSGTSRERQRKRTEHSVEGHLLSHLAHKRPLHF